MPNLILNLKSFNDYLLFNFRFDIKAFHKDCDNKGNFMLFIVLKTFNFSKAQP